MGVQSARLGALFLYAPGGYAGAMLKIAFLTNAAASSGVGYYATELAQSLAGHQDVALTEIALTSSSGQWPWQKKTFGWIRHGRKLRSEIGRGDFDIVHATNQTMSFVLPRGVRSVATVHDLIELLEPQQGLSGWAARYLYSGIKRADHIIAVSEYTKKTIIDAYGIPSNKITVIHNGVSNVFHPIEDFQNTVGYKTLQQELKLVDGAKIVLYVGSDHPRKNVATAIRAFAAVRQSHPEAIFLKVGGPGIAAGRVETLRVIDELGLRDVVRFIGTVSFERLNELYNVASVLIFPSRFEGFGLPPLQAMAAGTPVVAAGTTSIPEVAGEAALLHSADDVAGFAADLRRILEDAGLAAGLRQRGIERAKLFSWEKAAEQTMAVYEKILA